MWWNPIKGLFIRKMQMFCFSELYFVIVVLVRSSHRLHLHCPRYSTGRTAHHQRSPVDLCPGDDLCSRSPPESLRRHELIWTGNKIRWIGLTRENDYYLPLPARTGIDHPAQDVLPRLPRFVGLWSGDPVLHQIDGHHEIIRCRIPFLVPFVLFVFLQLLHLSAAHTDALAQLTELVALLVALIRGRGGRWWVTAIDIKSKEEYYLFCTGMTIYRLFTLSWRIFVFRGASSCLWTSSWTWTDPRH